MPVLFIQAGVAIFYIAVTMLMNYKQLNSIRRELILISVLSFIYISVSGQESIIQNIYGRTHISLNGRWNYIVDPYEMGYYDYRRTPFDQSATGKGGFYDNKKPKDKTDWVEYEFDLSPALKIPGDWNSQAEKLSVYEGTVWMRQKFTADPLEDKKYLLYFGAVNYEAQVYLNGKKLGIHKGGFTPFQFDVTGKLNKGENNVVVKADNSRHPDEIPTVNTDWWNNARCDARRTAIHLYSGL